MLKWPWRSRVQIARNLALITCNIVLLATRYKGTAQLLSLTEFKPHLFELYFIGWTNNRWRIKTSQTTYLPDPPPSVHLCPGGRRAGRCVSWLYWCRWGWTEGLGSLLRPWLIWPARYATGVSLLRRSSPASPEESQACLWSVCDAGGCCLLVALCPSNTWCVHQDWSCFHKFICCWAKTGSTLFFFFFFCVPQLDLGFTILGEIFVYVIVFFKLQPLR